MKKGNGRSVFCIMTRTVSSTGQKRNNPRPTTARSPKFQDHEDAVARVKLEGK